MSRRAAPAQARIAPPNPPTNLPARQSDRLTPSSPRFIVPITPSCRSVVEPLKYGKGERADLREQPAVAPDIGSREFRESEHELPVRQCQQEPLAHVLREHESRLLGTGRAEIERLSAGRAEVLVPALRIGACLILCTGCGRCPECTRLEQCGKLACFEPCVKLFGRTR